MSYYTARKASIVDEKGKQIAVVLPVNCSQKVAHRIAAYAAQQLNHDALQKERESQK